MTIDSTWIANFKEESPEAFTKHMPFQPKAVFCDGQIRLMRGYTQNLITWEDYIYQQFLSHVTKFYRTIGASTVILAFDDYAHVPEAKAMTQIKRRRHIPPVEILEREPLPPVCPSGTRWDQCIANRTFKAKVISMVVQRLPEMLKLLPGQTLIIDYKGHPVSYKLEEGKLASEELVDLHPLGEADVKFTRYASMFKDLLVDSIDGDSVPIALLYQEKCFRLMTQGTMDPKHLTDAPPRICIYRITTKLDEDRAERPAKKSKTDTDSSSQTDKKVARCSNRTYEYVNIPMLYLSLRNVFSQSMGRAVLFSIYDPYLMCLLTALIGLTGTDFTRHMPQLSGKSVFALLPNLITSLGRCYDTTMNQLHVDLAVDALVAGIYAAKFGVHVTMSQACPNFSLKSVLNSLRTSRLSQRTKESFPTLGQIDCTVKNVNWLLLYWTQPESVPCPVDPRFGFGRNEKGLVNYIDSRA
jgi:hypothetical protein